MNGRQRWLRIFKFSRTNLSSLLMGTVSGFRTHTVSGELFVMPAIMQWEVCWSNSRTLRMNNLGGPVAFYSRKLQGQRADGVNFHKNLGQIAWTPREKETYAIVTCLLKFQSWIGGQEVTVQTDHSAIVK